MFLFAQQQNEESLAYPETSNIYEYIMSQIFLERKQLGRKIKKILIILMLGSGSRPYEFGSANLISRILIQYHPILIYIKLQRTKFLKIKICLSHTL